MKFSMNLHSASVKFFGHFSSHRLQNYFTGLLFFLFLIISTSCGEDEIADDEVTKFLDEFNLVVVENSTEENIAFESIEDARMYLNYIKGRNINESTESHLTSILLDNLELSEMPNEAVKSRNSSDCGIMDDDCDFLIPDPVSGSGSFSQRYLPWMSIEANIKWQNNKVTSVSTGYSGVTVGAKWNQVSWRHISYSNGTYTFQVTYFIEYNLSVEGIGVVYTSEYRTSTGTYNTKTGHGAIFEP